MRKTLGWDPEQDGLFLSANSIDEPTHMPQMVRTDYLADRTGLLENLPMNFEENSYKSYE